MAHLNSPHETADTAVEEHNHNHTRDDYLSQQPGLETVDNAHLSTNTYKQVMNETTQYKESLPLAGYVPYSSPSPGSTYPHNGEVHNGGGGGGGVAGYNAVSQQPGYAPSQVPPPRRGRGLLLFGGAILIAVLAGVIGGIVGWKVTENKNNNSPAPTGGSSSDNSTSGGGGSGGSGGSSSSTAGASRAIRANSNLAVTGWRYGTDFRIMLFYQGPDDLVRYSFYDTLFGDWSAPRVMSTNVPALSGAPLTVSTLWWSSADSTVSDHPQVEMFFLGQGNKFAGHNWGFGGWAADGNDDSIVNETIILPAANKLATWWPSMIQQDSTGAIQEIKYNSTWVGPTKLGITGSAATSILALPLTTTHQGSDLRVLYRRTDGKLYTLDRDSTGATASTTGTLGFSLPENAPLGGFTYARDSSSSNVNTYVLWQDTSAYTNATGGIKFAFQNDDSGGWKGPSTDAIFAGADNGTQLACLTAATSWFQSSSNKPLSTATDMNMCFFQKGGLLKQVQFDGSKWVDKGFVSMP